jgi:mRNA interferase RelE/StbE
MPRYQIFYKHSVEKELRKLPTTMLQPIVARIQELATNPRPSGSIKLQGDTDLYRIRQGDYRIIYAIKDDVLTVLIIKIGHRKDVYR